MKLSFSAAVLSVLLLTSSPQAEAQQELGCVMLTGSVGGALGVMAASTNPGIALGALEGGLTAGVYYGVDHYCNEAIDAAGEALEEQMENIGFLIQWKLYGWPQGQYCAYGDQACYPVHEGNNEELALFLMQSWDATLHAIDLHTDYSSGSPVFTATVEGFAAQFDSSVNTFGVTLGFNAPPSPSWPSFIER